MKIYIAHSTNYDFKNELYVPLRNSALNSQHDIVLPHENDTFIKTKDIIRESDLVIAETKSDSLIISFVLIKDIIRESDLVIAETSYPSTGEGIELGWADSFKVPVEGYEVSAITKSD